VALAVTDASPADRDILPLFHCRGTSGAPQLVRLAGTAFRFGDRLLVTCWHCVAEDAPGHWYAAALPRETGGVDVVPLLDVAQAESGADLATASLAGSLHPARASLELSVRALRAGDDVWAYGYRSTPQVAAEDDPGTPMLAGCRLAGRVTRPFRYRHPQFGDVRSYEIGLAAPGGLSGAPLFRGPGRVVVGVLFARWGDSTLSHRTESLHELRGIATNGLRLADYVSELRQA